MKVYDENGKQVKAPRRGEEPRRNDGPQDRDRAQQDDTADLGELLAGDA